MIIYAHRGNLDGPEENNENRPSQIERALEAGFYAEVDIRRSYSGFWFGHDGADYRVEDDWINERRDRLLLHVKDFETLQYIADRRLAWHFICHASDPYTITSRSHVWLHDIRKLVPDDRTVVPLLSLEQLRAYPYIKVVGGICTDYPYEAHILTTWQSVA
jgi:hypothetical protein